MKDMISKAATLFIFGALAALAHFAIAAINIVTIQKLNWSASETVASEAVRTYTMRGYFVTAMVVDPTGHRQVVSKDNFQ
jgi:uncharacterized protein GlcG (DUF336 family)